MHTISTKYLELLEIKELKHHDVIYSVTTGLDGNIYFAPSSEFHPGSTARIYCYYPEENKICEVVNMTELINEQLGLYRPSHSKIHIAMVTGKNGTIYSATHLTARPREEKYVGIYETYGDSKRGYSGSLIIVYDPSTGKSENLGRAVEYEGARVMTIDKERNILYIISMPKSHLYSFDINTRKSKDLGRVSMENSLGMECDYRGFVYLTDDEGWIIRYDPEKDFIEKLSVQIPDAPWRTGQANYVRRTVKSPDGKTIWGCGTKSVRLFEYRTDEGSHGKMIDHGTFLGSDKFGAWPNLLACKAMSYGNDDRIYIAFSEDEALISTDNTRICSFDPATGEKRDFGRMKGDKLPSIITALDASTGLDGKIYFGTREKKPPPQLAIFTPPEDSELDEVSEIITPDYSVKLSKDIENWTINKKSSKIEISKKYKKTTPYVHEGFLTLQELGWSKLGLLIPDGESMITALNCTDSGKIYGVTSGQRSHIFSYDPFEAGYYKDSQNTYPMEIRVLENNESFCNNILIDSSGRLYMGTISGNQQKPESGSIYMYNPENEEYIWEEHGLPRRPFSMGSYDLHVKKIFSFKNKGIMTMTIDNTNGILYGLTFPDSSFFAFDLKSEKLLWQRELTSFKVCKALICDEEGNVYGSHKEGQLFIYYYQKDLIVDTKIFLPVQKGRDYLNTIDSLVWGDSSTFYGGVSDGYLFSFNVVTSKLISHGKPTMFQRIPALTLGHDGIVYGISGAGNDIAHLFKFDPHDNELKDLGILQIKGNPKFWVGHSFSSMITGKNGEIYIGESDRISHLFTYFPKYNKKAFQDARR